MAGMIASGHFDAVLGSRILGVGALRAECRSGSTREPVPDGDGKSVSRVQARRVPHRLRAFSRRLLETLPLEENSDDFVFDNQMLAQAIWFGFHIGEISCPRGTFRKRRRSISAAA